MGVPLLETPSDSAIALSRHGLVEYQKAWESQRAIHQDVVDGKRPNTLLLLEHPSVFTAGRRTDDSERPTDGTPVIDVDRGGRITWHGPGQLVGYPIVKLLKPTELVGFVREIEAGLIAVCSDLGLETAFFFGSGFGSTALVTSGSSSLGNLSHSLGSTGFCESSLPIMLLLTIWTPPLHPPLFSAAFGYETPLAIEEAAFSSLLAAL